MNVAEKKYYHDLLIKYKDNMRKSWGVIKNIINKKRSTTVQSQFKLKDGSITSDGAYIIATNLMSFS